MKTKLLRKFRKRFLITESKNSMFQYELIDLDKKEVYVNFVDNHKINSLQKAIYLGCHKIMGHFELQSYFLRHKKRKAAQAFRKALKDAIIEP